MESHSSPEALNPELVLAKAFGLRVFGPRFTEGLSCRLKLSGLWAGLPYWDDTVDDQNPALP